MKVFITKKEEENEYGIIKVADSLVEQFKKEQGQDILIEGGSIADVLIQFAAIKKEGDMVFNSELQKYKPTIDDRVKQETGRRPHRLN